MNRIAALVLVSCGLVSDARTPPQDRLNTVRKVTITCDESCTVPEKDDLPTVETLVQKIEDSDCFARFFKEQGGSIHESQGKSPEQIVADLRASTTTIRLSMYDLTRVQRLRFWNIPCGNDNENGESVEITHACWRAYSPVRRAGTIGHEEAHKAGFTHHEHGNTSGGNEHSVPYLVNAAFDACPNGDEKQTLINYGSTVRSRWRNVYSPVRAQTPRLMSRVAK